MLMNWQKRTVNYDVATILDMNYIWIWWLISRGIWYNICILLNISVSRGHDVAMQLSLWPFVTLDMSGCRRLWWPTPGGLNWMFHHQCWRPRENFFRNVLSEVEISFVWLVAAYVAICWASQWFWTAVFFWGEGPKMDGFRMDWWNAGKLFGEGCPQVLWLWPQKRCSLE